MIFTEPKTSAFCSDVLTGLTATPKWLPSKYFYDAEGDRLFQKIMQLPEYYLTRAELEIFKMKAHLIADFFDDQDFVQIIELGAGDGTKTRWLLESFIQQKKRFDYVPIDISGNALRLLRSHLSHHVKPSLIHPIRGEYFEALDNEYLQQGYPRLILFLGSTIGNFQREDARQFLARLSSQMQDGDRLLIGFDLVKQPKKILDAYNDRQGVTKQFNLNLLRRINRELSANFDIHAFSHFPVYDPVRHEAKSYLVSRLDQNVQIEAAAQTIFFTAHEPILTEVSRKFDLEQIRLLAAESRLKVVEIFSDNAQQFADVLLERL